MSNPSHRSLSAPSPPSDLAEGPTSFYRLEPPRRGDRPRLPRPSSLLHTHPPRERAAQRGRRPCDARARRGRSRVEPLQRGSGLPLHAHPRRPAGLHRACPRSWTWPPCGTGSARWAAIPARINPLVPADLVIDHSVQVDFFGTGYAFERNVAREYERNRERYALLRWAQEAFENYSVVPPGTRASCIRSTWSIWRRSSTGASTAGPCWPTRTRWSGRTRTPRWSTDWAWWAGGSGESRPRPCCWGSRTTCCSPRWWA